jgi:hypothetical protein
MWAGTGWTDIIASGDTPLSCGGVTVSSEAVEGTPAC